MTDDLHPALAGVFTPDHALPPSTREAVLALGDQAVEPLIGILGSEEYAYEDSLGAGYAPIHAAALLGTLQATCAIPALLDAHMRSEPMEIMYSTSLFALRAIGAPRAGAGGCPEWNRSTTMSRPSACAKCSPTSASVTSAFSRC